MPKKTKIFNLTALTTLMVFSLAGCSKVQPSDNTNNSSSFNGDDFDLKDVIFESKTISYDGQPHTIFATNVPEGVKVEYLNNTGTDVGTYNAIAHFTSKDGRIIYKDKYATLTITDDGKNSTLDFSNLTMDNVSAKYDGTKHTARLKDASLIPAGFVARYSNNEQINAGKYVAKCEIVNRKTNAVHYSIYSNIVISKASYDMSGISFPSQTFPYVQGRTYTIEIQGELPKGVTVTYQNNTARTAGSITTATANFHSSDSNYEDPKPMQATLTVSTDQTCVITINYFLDNNLIQNTTVSKRYGEYFTDSDILKRTGYSYTTNRDLSGDGLPINSQSMTINVYYVASIYECSFVVDHGKKDSIKFDVNSNEVLTDPEMDAGYQFIGWFEDAAKTIPITTLQGRSGSMTVYAAVSELTNTNSFILKNATYKWDSTGKTIDTLGALPANRRVTYVYEKIDDNNGQSTILEEGKYPTDVGTYKVTGQFHNYDVNTGVIDNAISFTQTAYLFITKNSLDTSNIKFNGGTYYADSDKKTPTVEGVIDYINYTTGSLIGNVPFNVIISYKYYDSDYNLLPSAPTTIGSYIAVAHFEIFDTNSYDATDRIEKIPDISTNFSITKRTYSVDNIRFENATYKTTDVAPEGGWWKLVASQGVREVNGRYYTSDGYIEITYSNNTIKYGDVGSLQAGMFFSWAATTPDNIRNMYDLPSPKYATLSVISDNTCSVTFKTEDGTILSQSEVTVESAVAVPTPSSDVLNKLNIGIDEEYYFKPDTGEQLTSVSHITRDTVFTLSKRSKISKIVISGYYQKDGENVSNIESLLNTTYSKDDNKSLKDLMLNFSLGYELSSFQLAKLSSIKNPYYTDADFQTEILPNSDDFNLSLYQLFKKYYGDVTIEDILIKVNTKAKTIKVNYEFNGAENSDALNREINGNTALTTQTYGSTYNLPTTVPSKEGLKFIGWQLNSSYISSSSYCNLILQEGTVATITAIFEDITHFSASFITNNGENPSISNLLSNQVIPFSITDPTKYGYKFIGWKLNGALYDSDGNQLTDGKYALIDKNTVFDKNFVKTYFDSEDLRSLVFEAVWETIEVVIRMYSYEYDSNGSLKVFREINSKFNEKFLDYLPTDLAGNLLYPENEGSNFLAWTYNGRNIILDTKITSYNEENGFYYVNITPTYDSETFTIVYDGNYPTCSTSIQQVKGSENYQLASSLKRTGYTFAYWYLDGDLDADGNPINFYTEHYLKDEGKFVYKRNLILKAYWTIKTYQVSFVNRTNNTNWTNSVYYPYGTTLDLNHGWIDSDNLYNVLRFTSADKLYFTDANSRMLEEGAPLLFDSDTETTYTIYVLRTAQTFLVSYYVDSNSQVLQQVVEADKPFTLLTAPSRPGMQFNGWSYYAGDSLVLINGDTFTLLTSADLTLYASFDPIQYTIKYVLPATGTEIHEETIVTFGQTFSLPNANEISINGYNFISWRDVDGNSVDSDTLLKTPPSDTRAIILYAVVEPAEFTITYDANNGSDAPHVDNVKYNTTFNVYADPVRKGYSFSGWAYYDATTNLRIKGETATLLKQGTFAYSGNVRAVATWIGITFEVRFTFDGLKLLKDAQNNYYMDSTLTKLNVIKNVALGTNIDMIYDADDLFTITVTVDGVNYKAYQVGDELYLDPVGLFYDSLSTWVESATNVAVKNEKNSKYLLTNTGGTEFSANYVKKNQNFTFRIKTSNEERVLLSTNFTYGSTITIPDYEPNDLYDFYGWIAEENHIYNSANTYEYVAGAKILYDVKFDRYAAKNNFIFNIVYDSKKAYYIIKMDGVKYLQVDPAGEISESDKIYTEGLTDDEKQAAMADDVIGKINKGNSPILPNIAKNINNDYYKPITVDGLTFHPCDRTIYKIGSEFIMDGSTYNIGITGTKDNPTILEAYSCYVAGQYRENNGDKFTDFMILKDSDSSGNSFVNANGTQLRGLNEVAFCGFVNKKGAQTVEIITSTVGEGDRAHGEFYIPPYYFDGVSVKKVSMIANGGISNNEGAFTNIKFKDDTNIHLPDSILTIAANSFDGVTIIDNDAGSNGKSSFSKSDYDLGLVTGKIIYEGSLDYFRNNVTVYDTNLSSSSAIHPVWCFDSANSKYDKDVNYSVISWWDSQVSGDTNDFIDPEKIGKLNTTRMYIAENSSITLNYFYGTKEEYLAYCQANFGGKLNRGDTSNRFVAVFNAAYDPNNPNTDCFYPEIIYTGDSTGTTNVSSLLALYPSANSLTTNNILGRRISFYDDSLTTPTWDYLYLANAQYALDNYNDLLTVDGKTFADASITNTPVNIASSYSLRGDKTIYYPMSFEEYANSTYRDNILGKIVYVKENVRGRDVAFRVYDKRVSDTADSSDFTAQFINDFYNENTNEFIYFFINGTTFSDSHLTFFGNINNILNSDDNIAIASKQADTISPTISIYDNYSKTNEFYYGSYTSYVNNRITKANMTKAQIYDGKTIITMLNDGLTNLIQGYMGSKDQFKAHRDSGDDFGAVFDTIYRAVLENNDNDKEIYIYYGQLENISSINYNLYSNKYAYSISANNGEEPQLVYIGTASNFIDSTYNNENSKYVYLNGNNEGIIYTYAVSRTNSNLFPVITSKYTIDYTEISNLEKYGLAYFYLEDKINNPTTANHNNLLPYYFGTFEEAYKVDTIDSFNRYSTLRNSTAGFISSADGYSVLATASTYYTNFLSSSSNYDKISTIANGGINTLISNNIQNYQLDTIDKGNGNVFNGNGTFKDYFNFKPVDQLLSKRGDLKSGFAKCFTSSTDRTPIDYYMPKVLESSTTIEDVYQEILQELKETFLSDDPTDTIEHLYYADNYDLKKILYFRYTVVDYGDHEETTDIVTTFFFNGTASEYLTSNYVTDASFNSGEEVVKLKDNISFYFGDVLNMTAAKVDSYLSSDQIYALLNNDANTTKNNAKLVLFYNKTAEDYRSKFNKGKSEVTDANPNLSTLDNPNNYVFIGNNNYNISLLLLTISDVEEDILSKNNLNKDAEVIFIDSTTTTVTYLAKTEDAVLPGEPENNGVAVETTKVMKLYLGTTGEFNASKIIKGLSDYNSSTYGEFVFTLDNAIYNSTRSIVSCFYMNYNTILSNNRFFSTSTSSDKGTYIEMKVVDSRISFTTHFVFSDLKSKGFVSNIGKFNTDGSLIGIEDDYLVYYSAYSSSSSNQSELLFFNIKDKEDTTGSTITKVYDSFVITPDTFDTKSALKLTYTGKFFTNDDNQPTTNRRITGIMDSLSYNDPQNPNYEITGNTAYHQLLDLSITDLGYSMVEIPHQNYEPTGGVVTNDTAYFVAKTFADFETNDYYKKLSIYTPPIENADGTQTDRWEGTNTDGEEGIKYSVYVIYNDDDTSAQVYIRAYGANN